MSRKTLMLFMAILVLMMAACTPAATQAPTRPPAPTEAPAPTDVPPTEAPAPTDVPPTKEPTPEPEPVELTVFAAASLTDAFTQIGEDFSAANPGVTVVYNFAGSNQLATQLGEGAPADVFASANNTQMLVAIDAGRVMTETQHTFVRNRLVVIYPEDNPGELETLQDLATPGVDIVLAAAEVPVGQYSLDFLDKAVQDATFGPTFKNAVLANVVSYEENVRAVFTKIALGEGDAGIVYSSDVVGEGSEDVAQLEIPDPLNTIASYPIAVVTDSANPDVAQAFVDYVRGEDGQTVLVEYGFISTIGSATGEAPGNVPVEVIGLVNTPTTFSADDLRQLEQTTITAEDSSGPVEFTGVLLSTVLEQVGVRSGAQTIGFTGGDGYTQELPLADVTGDPEAIIAIDEAGALRNVLPSTRPRFWVKGLVTIELK